MEKIKNYKLIIILLSLDLLALLYGISTLSISADEADIYFGEQGKSLIFSYSLLYYISHFGTFIFGQNDFGLRLPFLFFHFLSCLLLYLLALKYTKTKIDAFFALLLFVLLPGTVASALLVNAASLVIFLTLAILCAYEYEKKWLFYILLIIVLFVDKSFNILFLTFFFFGIYKRNAILFTLSLVLFGASISFYGFDTGGRPRGYFLDTLGIFAACFSPLVFVYFFYTIYRLTFQKYKNLLWFLMSVTFVFCLLLSLRQKLFLDDFNTHKGTNLSSLGAIVLVPMAIYSNSIKDIKDIPNGAKIAIPNDATNESRALDLLAKANLIEFKSQSTLKTPIDISKNPKNLKFIELKAAQLPRALNDTDLAVITTNYALGAGLNPLKDGIFMEDKDSLYAIVLATRKGEETSQKSLVIKEILTSDKIKNFIIEKYKGSVIPTF